MSGFGETGPNFQRPAFDQIAQALGGGMSITGLSAKDPMRAGIPIGDLGGGMFAVMGIQAAIISRNETGTGQHVDISMLDCQISMLNYMATMHTMSGIIPEPIGNSHFVHMPYDTFLTKDYPIVIAAVGDQFWQRLLKIFKDPELKNPVYEKAYKRQSDKEKIAAINWGLVDGKTNTKYPWKSWVIRPSKEPEVWHHDIFRSDGTPYSRSEVNFIRKMILNN